MMTIKTIKLPENKSVDKVFNVIKKSGYDVRIVGGFVRDTLLGKTEIGDYDFATTATPDIVQDIFNIAGYKTISTGIDYGTITVVIDSTPFEITTLRKDVETDGRRAVVSYTTDWKIDAQRRDFTINGMYVDDNGSVYDSVGGLVDLESKTICFIGDADLRISEDALRILRLFRFTVSTGFDIDGKYAIEACKKGATLIKNLSIERISNEMIEMLSYNVNPTEVLRTMMDLGVLASVIPFPIKPDLPMLQGDVGISADYLVKICALAEGSYSNAGRLANVWKLSNADKRKIKNILQVYNDRTFTPELMHKFAYYYGVDIICSAGLLKGGNAPKFIDKFLSDFEMPVFPVSGDELIALGAKQGVKLGALLKAVELWWVEKDFKPRKQDCLLFAKQAERLNK